MHSERPLHVIGLLLYSVLQSEFFNVKPGGKENNH